MALNKWEIHTSLIAPSDLSPVLVTHIDSEMKTKQKDYKLSHCRTKQKTRNTGQ